MHRYIEKFHSEFFFLIPDKIKMMTIWGSVKILPQKKHLICSKDTCKKNLNY